MAAACAVCAECGETRVGCACHGFGSAPRAAAKRGEVQCAVDALGGVWGFFFGVWRQCFGVWFQAVVVVVVVLSV